MRRIKCGDATERKWNLRNMLENEKEPRDVGTGRRMEINGSSQQKSYKRAE